jgi:uncharacterized membrane protein
MTLDAIKGRDVSVASFRAFLTRERFIRVLLLELVVIPIFIVGLVLLVIPGIYWFVITILAYFIVVGKNDVSTLDAISKSISAVKGYGWQIFLYVFIYSMISFFASLVPVLSVVTDTLLTPVLYVLLALIYRESLKKND